ncbi:TylF/MycF/NovP-related O-methyltransferase [Loktanella agnita]|uniref:TylF/MycF/NovP-related O-methyltransferase n=1 Tax=Loktanella agnita TaxID=287097 RepID=UPI0039870128
MHEGWFHETLPATIPDQIAFAHLDANYPESTKIGLEYLYPRLAKGAICLLDDYADTTVFQSVDFFKGVKQACDAYLADKPEEVTLLYGGYDSIHGFGSHGYFIKR